MSIHLLFKPISDPEMRVVLAAHLELYSADVMRKLYEQQTDLSRVYECTVRHMGANFRFCLSVVDHNWVLETHHTKPRNDRMHPEQPSTTVISAARPEWVPPVNDALFQLAYDHAIKDTLENYCPNQPLTKAMHKCVLDWVGETETPEGTALAKAKLLDYHCGLLETHLLNNSLRVAVSKYSPSSVTFQIKRTKRSYLLRNNYRVRKALLLNGLMALGHHEYAFSFMDKQTVRPAQFFWLLEFCHSHQ